MTKKSKIPKEILLLKSGDKQDREKWHKQRDLMDFPGGSFRAIISGPPSSGKTNLIKNIIIKANPLYDQVYLVHFDPYSKDYEDADVTVLEDGELPHNDDIDVNEKNLIIFEDINYESLSKEQKLDLASLFKYVSSHKNCNIIWSCHDPVTGIPPSIRRLANLYVIFRLPDVSSLSTIGSKCGINANDFQDIFKNFIKKQHDNLCIDMTSNTPAKLRINMYNVLSTNDDD